MSKSVDLARESDGEHTEEEVAYKKNDLVAFVDKGDAELGKQTICIGKVSFWFLTVDIILHFNIIVIGIFLDIQKSRSRSR